MTRQATLPKDSLENDDDDNSDLDESLKIGKKLSVSYLSSGSYYETSKSSEERKISNDFADTGRGVKRKIDELESEVVEDTQDKGHVRENEEIDDDEDVEPGSVDIHAYAEKVIADARYKALNGDALQVPACLNINQAKVADLKSLLMSTPDKTQTWCGGVVVVDENDVRVSPIWIYVNHEIYVAMQELACEGRNTDKIPVVLHVVHEEDPIDVETLGMFLKTNSKEFSSRLHEKMLYQDIFTFCCTAVVIEDENGEDVKTFLKKTLKNLSKGAQNVSTFLNFACLPVGYLNRFQQFIRLFESGSLNGQKLSFRKVRNMDKNGKRKTSCRLEVSLSLFKFHLSVSQHVREKLLLKLLTKKIEFAVYMQLLGRMQATSLR